MLPEMGISILDKVSFFRAADRQFNFPEDCEAIVQRELPFFCRWLLDWVAPAHAIGETRFGTKEYHEPSLLAAANEQGRVHFTRELLEIFARLYFNADNTTTEFTGTSTDFYAQMILMEPLAPIVRKTFTITLGKDLTSLSVREPEFFGRRRLKGQTLYTLNRSILG